jgi:hypothetical protein
VRAAAKRTRGDFLEMRNGALGMAARLEVTVSSALTSATWPPYASSRRARDPFVQLAAPRRRHAVAEHALMEGMIEAIRAGYGAVGPFRRAVGAHERAVACQAIQTPLDFDGLRVERRRDQRGRESPPDRAAGLERARSSSSRRSMCAAMSWSKPGGTPAASVDRSRCSRQTPPAADDRTVGGEIVRHARQKERVAVRALVQRDVRASPRRRVAASARAETRSRLLP